ncbi:hypothetical protein ACFY7C_30180 [Streptomyces sp. NPDC012769]|uniref:hypothetical protein n=1 Tax=Streptomyces sp. NPDC012769 TaxID=3364848 RepID=UPI003676EDBD
MGWDYDGYGAGGQRQSPGARMASGALGIVVAVGLAILVLRPELMPWRDAGDTSPLAVETERPSVAPSEETFPDRPTLREPFKGSPALRWADGAAGIEPPAAKATGWMSKAQVAEALKKSKRFLVAANLDPAVIKGGKPAAALGLLDPKDPDTREELERSLELPTEENDPTALFTRFSPHDVRQVGTVVKTRGRMTVENGRGEDAGLVLIRADYTFVYPVVKARPGADEVARTIVRRQVTFAIADPARYVATRGRLFLYEWQANVGNDDCDEPLDGFLHPVFDSDLMADPDAPSPTGPAVDPYDRSKGIDELPQECTTSSRT